MKKFSSIEQFRHVVKYVRKKFNWLEEPTPTLTFIGTVKLHGTNAGIRFQDGKFIAQSRKNPLSIEEDNYGFAAFVQEIPFDELFTSIFNEFYPKQNITIFGEWIGEGIQKNVAISQLSKQFVIFGAWDHDSETYIPNNPAWRLPEYGIYNILDIDPFTLSIDFNRPEDALKTLEEITLSVEEECPWGKHFNISGIGEGVVWTCLEHPEDSDLWFKVKGDKHGNKGNTKKLKRSVANIEPEKLNTIREVVEYVLPEWRLQQGLTELKEQGLDLEMPNLGVYLKWIGQDVKKEEMDTIVKNGLEWKEISSFITTTAKNHFIKEYNKF